MRVVMAGGSGFLGGALAEACVRAGDDVVVLTRKARPASHGITYVTWDPAGPASAWAPALEGAEALVNLAGASIADRRWSSARKVQIWDSRMQATRALTAAMGLVAVPPRRVISGSAVGYYGSRGDEVLTEDSTPGADFLGRLCVAWEGAAAAMASDRTTVACVRTGLVLGKGGGALPRMALPFRMGAGGRLGDGTQYMSWIHRDDWVGLVRHLLAHDEAGAFNLTAPEPVTNSVFTETLARVLHRPALLPAPAFALRLALGEMADALLLASQRVLPARAATDGFSWRYASLAPALEAAS